MLKQVVLMMLLTVLIGAQPMMFGAVQGQEIRLPSLAEPGPYDVYYTELTFVDENREDWELQTLIWFPADTAQGTPAFQGSSLLTNVPPDRRGAPYPLIVYSHGGGGSSYDLQSVTEHLASYGYVVAAPQHHDLQIDHAYVDRPLDILTVINGLADITDGDLAGMVDTDNVGLMGWSQGAEASLQMIGLLYDPIHYESWCAVHPDLITSDCSNNLHRVSEYRAQLDLEDLPDGRWQPFGDDRIHAILPIDPCSFPLTTDDMFTEVSTPVMFVHGVRDDTCDYAGNSVRSFTGMTSEDRYLISMIYGGHGPSPSVLKHFAPAFFGLYLHGDKDLAAYLTAEQAETMPDVAWGPYEGE